MSWTELRPIGIEGGASTPRTIDVSNLPQPLPVVRILETLREIGPGQTLLVRHTRRPHRLYPKLDALGCAHQTAELTGGHVEIRITRPAASQT